MLFLYILMLSASLIVELSEALSINSSPYSILPMKRLWRTNIPPHPITLFNYLSPSSQGEYYGVWMKMHEHSSNGDHLRVSPSKMVIIAHMFRLFIKFHRKIQQVSTTKPYPTKFHWKIQRRKKNMNQVLILTLSFPQYIRNRAERILFPTFLHES